jgi:membrane protein DedA with SNARE-associated domain
MNDALFQLVSHYGVAVIFAATFLSCLAVPVPTSLLMLAGGAFVASGDLSAGPVMLAALAGAVLGDQAGFRIGRSGAGLVARLESRERGAALLAEARGFVARWGGVGVFLSRWLFSPLGPYVNFVGGAAGIGWRRFSAWGIMGETVWVAIYVGLGYLFAGHITEIADILGNAMAFLAAGAAALILGAMLLRAARAPRHRPGR